MSGSGSDAHAFMEAVVGDIFLTLSGGEITLTPGSGSNADAVLIANQGTGLILLPIDNCINCNVLPTDPFLDLVSQSGIFSLQNLDEITNIGTSQLIVLNEYQDDVVVGIIDPESDDEDEEKSELVCR